MNAIPVKSKIASDQVLKISPFKEVIKPTVPHKHADYFELIVLSQGAGFHTIDDYTFDVTPPDIYFLKPGQTHCWDFSRIPKGFVILFREELLNSEGLEVVYQLPAHISLADGGILFELVKRFYQDYQSNTSLTILKTYLQLILLKILEQSGAFIQRDVTFNAVYYQFKSLVNENYQRIKKIQDYADLLKMPASRLNLICRNASGKTPSMLLNERILLESKTLLSNTPLSIKEIAATLDFSDTSHFVKFFKINTNLTPGLYRELAFASAKKSV
ncbi:helix-turn-helix domain-containing protein [Mucilaginibacter sp. HC2]|uniref:helix-turn-helix domain-containing protein n=1 Tax=Mucilaginibacter inviolabilis TaxID=2714892 RepID=UPI00140990C1|nr:helix-turn-helix domain-containing protein [Mucilaginibacter inviolabilis]NHA03325.1 helix-turn-helix domain-containing protein [Mucilaginibacter inviolabilis]